MPDLTIKGFLASLPNDISILIGNGLGKSHPTYHKAFEFDSNYVFRKFIIEIFTHFFDTKTFGLKENLINYYDCPEKFFKAFRVEMLFISLMYYIENLSHTCITSIPLKENLRECLQQIMTQ